MDFPMAISDPASSPRAATGILRSYVDDLKHWLSGIGKRYAVGLAILLVGTAAALTATGFGVAAFASSNCAMGRTLLLRHSVAYSPLSARLACWRAFCC